MRLIAFQKLFLRLYTKSTRTHFNFNKLVNFPTWHLGKLRKNLKICAAAGIFPSILNFANRYLIFFKVGYTTFLLNCLENDLIFFLLQFFFFWPFQISELCVTNNEEAPALRWRTPKTYGTTSEKFRRVKNFCSSPSWRQTNH